MLMISPYLQPYQKFNMWEHKKINMGAGKTVIYSSLETGLRPVLLKYQVASSIQCYSPVTLLPIQSNLFVILQWEREEIFPAHEVFKKLANAGLLGINKPVEYGGLGLDYKYQMAFLEATGTIRASGVGMGIGKLFSNTIKLISWEAPPPPIKNSTLENFYGRLWC